MSRRRVSGSASHDDSYSDDYSYSARGRGHKHGTDRHSPLRASPRGKPGFRRYDRGIGRNGRSSQGPAPALDPSQEAGDFRGGREVEMSSIHQGGDSERSRPYDPEYTRARDDVPSEEDRDWWDITSKVILCGMLVGYIGYAVYTFMIQKPAIIIETARFHELDYPTILMCPIGAQTFYAPVCAAGDPDAIGLPTPDVALTSNCSFASFDLCTVFNYKAPFLRAQQSNAQPALLTSQADFSRMQTGMFHGFELYITNHPTDPEEIDRIAALPPSDLKYAQVYAYVNKIVNYPTTVATVGQFGVPTLLSLQQKEYKKVSGEVATKWLPSTATISMWNIPPSSLSTTVLVGMRYQDFAVETQAEEQTAQVVGLLGEIGGIIGMLLGASILSLVQWSLSSMKARRLKRRQQMHARAWGLRT